MVVSGLDFVKSLGGDIKNDALDLPTKPIEKYKLYPNTNLR